jgi:type II secretory pathway component PulM
MKTWWSDRAPRERLLLSLAALVGLAALLFQGVLMPSLHGREAAARRLDEAERTLVRLNWLQQSGASYTPPAAAIPPDEAARQAAQWAAEIGLVQRPSLNPADHLRFAFDPADPTVVFSWIDRVETGLHLTLLSAEMESAGSGQVAATLVFSGDPPP